MNAIRPFDQFPFLVLPENRLAVAAVNKLGPKVRRRVCRLVTVVGPAGCGKSRLARELIRGWDEARDDGKRLLVTASEYAAQFAEASEHGAIPQFQTRYRHDVRLLVCEDVQMLGPRKETQQQLLAAIDEIISEGGLVLLTSTRMPGEITGLSRRLVNRMHGGICAPLELPGEESRRALIDHFLSIDPLPLTSEEVGLIAEKHAVSPRELLGLLTQLRMESQTRSGRNRSTRNVEEILEGLPMNSKFSLADISRVTARTFGVRMADLKSPRRSQTLTLARQTAMYLARNLAGMQFSTIGNYFNRRNHSTVIHACQKIETLLEDDPRLAHDVATIRKQLESGTP